MSSVQSFLSELKQNYEQPKKKHRRNNEKGDKNGLQQQQQQQQTQQGFDGSVCVTVANRQRKDDSISSSKSAIESNHQSYNKQNNRAHTTSVHNIKEKKEAKENYQRDRMKSKNDDNNNKITQNIDTKKRKNKVTKDKHESSGESNTDIREQYSTDQTRSVHDQNEQQLEHSVQLNNLKLPPHKYILAPMVGASELAFRLLCRKYGAEIAYTPMMNADSFVNDIEYQKRIEYSTHTDADHPVVVHFASNDPKQFANAAKEAVYGPTKADAIDLNLGCPQRTAYVGHYGSYLLDKKDRQLICDMIRQAVIAVPDTPIFCKIRLLPTINETIELVQNLKNAGASLVAIHARYRASWERVGPGARDGPALLEQVQQIRVAVPDITIITNGNTITWNDVTTNLSSTTAHGIMSAEGLLDNPALYLPRYGSRNERDKQIQVWSLVPKVNSLTDNETMNVNDIVDDTELDKDQDIDSFIQKRKKLLKKLDTLKTIQTKIETDGIDKISDKEKNKLISKLKYTKKLAKLDRQIRSMKGKRLKTHDAGEQKHQDTLELKQITVPLGTLYDIADDKVQLVVEYLDLATVFPVIIRSVIFHVRRMIKDELVQYQLLEDCIKCTNITEVRAIVNKVMTYQRHPEQFVYDQKKAIAEKESIEKRKREESKRKDYEARMIRKAKREGLTDLSYYLTVGAAIPTIDQVQQFKNMSRSDVLTIWKQNHSQHCLSYHIDSQKCQRGRTCAFLHIDPIATNESLAGSNSNHNHASVSFIESDEVAG
jgi:tRNA-dihydrouridine synthase 1